MKLIVLGPGAKAPRTGHSDTWLLPLAGIPAADDKLPPDLLQLADEAAAEVRENFPAWLWQWCRSNGVLNIHSWSGPISWWWYTPLSEKSPLRSGLIQDLYILTLIRKIYTRHPLEALEWHGGDRLLAQAVSRSCAAAGIPFQTMQASGYFRRSRAFAFLRRIRSTVSHGLTWLALKLFDYSQPLEGTYHAVFYTLFPALWEFHPGQSRARMYGTWPDFLLQQGHNVFYAVAAIASPFSFWARRGEWRRIARDQHILFLETLLTFRDWLSAHFSLRFFTRYLKWRITQSNTPVLYLGTDITDLWWRELDANVLSAEIPQDQCLSMAWSRLVKQHSSLQAVFQHFEYQPMERALINGVRLASPLPVIGTQAGTFTANQMGFIFPVDEAQVSGPDPLKAPLPDYLAAYGALPYQAFSERLGADRVCPDAPLRYSNLRTLQKQDPAAFRSQHAIPMDATLLALTTPLSRPEALYLLDGALRLLAENSAYFLLIKFHYHTPLYRELHQMASAYAVSRFRLFETGLYDLMNAAPVLLTAGSSTAMEAIALNCMPVVFRSAVELTANPMLDTPEGVFFWQNYTQLRQAVQSCLGRDGEFHKRQAAWPGVLRAQWSTSTASPDQQLYDFLNQRGILSKAGLLTRTREAQHEAV